jgi:hypothetical protein
MTGPAVNPDTYRARAVTAALGYTQAGKPQVAVEFVLLDGGYLSQNEFAIGQHITWYGYFGEKSIEHTMKALRTCGWSTDSIDDLTGVDEQEVSLVLVEENDLQGYPRIKVRWINAPGGVGGVALKARMAPDEARSFADQMRGYAQASRATAPPAAAPARPAAPPARAAAAPPARPAPRPPARPPAAIATAAAGLDPDDNIPF